jgi:hypothetical protein
MKTELERGDDAEVAAAPPNAPEEVGIVTCARPQDLTVCGDNFGRKEVVAGQPQFAAELAEAAAEGQSRNPGVAVHAHGRRETESLGRSVEFAQRRARCGASDPSFRIDLDGLHVREVNDQTIFADRRARDVVPTAANRDGEIAHPGEGESAAHVGGSPAIGDDSGPFVYRPVPHSPCAIVVLALRGDDPTAEILPQLRSVEPGCRLEQSGSRHAVRIRRRPDIDFVL